MKQRWIEVVTTFNCYEIEGNSRIELHVTRNCHFLFALVNLFDPFFEISPYLLEVDVLQARITAEIWSSCHDDDLALSHSLLRTMQNAWCFFCRDFSNSIDKDSLHFHCIIFCVSRIRWRNFLEKNFSDDLTRFKVSLKCYENVNNSLSSADLWRNWSFLQP